MRNSIPISQNRIAIIEYYERTQFPDSIEIEYNNLSYSLSYGYKAEEEKNQIKEQMERISKVKGDITIRVDKILVVTEALKKKLEFNEFVYPLSGSDLGQINQEVERIKKSYEGKTQTLAEYLLDV